MFRIPEKTDDGWETGDLRDENLDAGLIKGFFDEIIAREDCSIHSGLLVRGNRLIVEEYFTGTTWNGKVEAHNAGTLHTLQSVTKSVNSILVGIAVDHQLIGNVDEKASTFFPDLAGTGNISLKHLLSMTAGLDWNEYAIPYRDPCNDSRKMNEAKDPIHFLFTRPSVLPAGSKFAYNSAIALALGEIVHTVCGVSVDRFADCNLFKPLGISDSAWIGTFPNGVIHSGGGLFLRPRDMAKIGCMMLNNGRWQGKQVVSETWVKESFRKQAPDCANGYEYGYQWWLRTFKVRGEPILCFLAKGSGGQCILISPTLDMVIVFTAWNKSDLGPLLTLTERYILSAAC